MEEKLKKLLEDPSFLEEVSKTTSAEDASALFAQHGIHITPEDLTAALAQPEGELNENELDGVAGGCGWCVILRRIGELLGPIRPWWWNRR